MLHPCVLPPASYTPALAGSRHEANWGRFAEVGACPAKLLLADPYATTGLQSAV